MNTHHTIGIDLGSNSLKMVIAESHPTEKKPTIIHTFETASVGIRSGYVVDIAAASESLGKLIKRAEKEYSENIRYAKFAIGGVGLMSQYVRTSSDDFKKDHEISQRDVEDVIQKSEDLFSAKYPNKKILHIIPVKYRVDDRDVLGTPMGMYGSSLEVKVIFITIMEHHYDAFVSVIEKNNIGIDDIIAIPLADVAGSTSYTQKNQGVLVANIGSETTSLATFENGIITSLDILSIGSNDITNDIALGLQIPLEEADSIKRNSSSDHPKRKIEEIVHARIADILELITRHLIKIKKNRLLPAGIIYTGAGAKLLHLNEYTKEELKLPATTVSLKKISKKTKRTIDVPEQFSVAYGLCISEQGRQLSQKKKLNFSNLKRTLNYWFNQIMP